MNPSKLDELYHYTFSSAIEAGGYGIGYWCEVKDYKIKLRPKSKAEWNNYSATIQVTEFGGDESDLRLVWKGAGGPSGRHYIINRAVMSRGMRLVASGKTNVHRDYAKRFSDALRNPDDADLDGNDADIAVQAGLFGEVIFG